MDNKISLSFSGGYKVLNPVPLDPRCRPETMTFAATDPTYYVGFSPVLDSITGTSYKVAGGDAVTGWLFVEEGDKSFEFMQPSSSNHWIIEHNLDKYPSVTIKDSAGTLLEGEVDYINKNIIHIKLSAALKGTAYLN